MKIDDIKQIWEKDSKISQDDLATESLRTPSLHSKYYNIYVDEKLQLKKQETDHKYLRRLKYEYYLGRLSPEQIKKLGWDDFDLKILRGELDVYIESDIHLTTSLIAIAEQQEKVNFLESIIKVVNGRGFHIKSAVDFIRWTQGG